ncbi:putative lipid II flippase FtsW [Nocardioides rotundus]|uniref:putative lipid II flippase FtsW n=1 Tax=Nocardioides rotundus TaxID=1774216 RepID=UPI001CBC4BF5|nr:putative lipid II flippase FtsW [Nocardioides rotundus]UAL31009.1 putative lipid II flippase FtsW [Nocardioides rotundus]
MTDLAPPRPSAPAARSTSSGSPARRPGPLGWLDLLREALNRPLANYYMLLVASSMLLVIGLIMVASSSSVFAYESTGNSYSVVLRQVTWVILGLPCAWVASRLPYAWIRRLAYPAYAFALVLLLLTWQFGTVVNGNQNWLVLGPVRIQPAEIAKLALVLWAAHVYAHKERALGRLHHIMVPVIPGFVLATGLVVIGRDLGTALVFFGILLGLLWAVGAPARLFALAALVISSAALFLATTSSERRERLMGFTDPLKDFNDSGWQPAHGLFALSSGGWFGEGIGASRQKWGNSLGQAAHTDFIFAVLGEELGLVGALLVVGLFLTIAFAAIRVATHTADPFVRYLCFGIVVWLLGQMIINVGMVLALLPVIGIPLPLVSYGGSALLPSLVALGLLVGAARREPAAARALAARRRTRSAGLAGR